MKLYICDWCFKQKEVGQIVGTEFDYHGYKTLSPQFRFVNGCYECDRIWIFDGGPK